LVFPPPRPAREHARQLEPYLASIDTTLKELDAELTQAHLITPYIDRVTRILERLEQREARETCTVPAAPIPEPRAAYMSPPVAQHCVPARPEKKGNTILQYFSRPSSSEASRSKAAWAPDAPSETATPVWPDTPPSEGVPPTQVVPYSGGRVD